MPSKLLPTFISVILMSITGCNQEFPDPHIEISILSPEEGSFFFPDEPVRILVETTSEMGFDHLELYLNDSPVGETDNELLDIKLEMPYPSEGSQQIKVRAFDLNQRSVEAAVTFSIVNSGDHASGRESFVDSFEERWFLSNWAGVNSFGWDDNNSLRSSNREAYAITRKQFHEPGSICFHVKKGSGNLEFHLDGQVRAKWFGKEDWGYYAYAIPKGEHVFKWISDAEDTYIDHVEFIIGVEQHTPGEYFGGGIVFYIDSTSRHGLIAALQDGEYEGNMAQSPSNGKANTRAIVADCKVGETAARYCDDLSLTEDTMVFDDWYLPALNQLDHLHTYKEAVGNVDGQYYWSSTTRAPILASVINFWDGSHHSAHRDIPNVMGPVMVRIHVRPIRDF